MSRDRGAFWAGWLYALAVLAAPGCTAAGSKEKVMSEAKGRLECVGRFCLVVPAGHARAGETFKFGLVSMEEVALPDGEHAFEALWAAQMGNISALRTEATRADDRTGRIRERIHLGPTFEVAIYHNSDVGNLGGMSGLLEREGRGLRLERQLNFGFRDQLVGKLEVIGRAWRPRRGGEPWPIPGKNAFYLGTSALVEPAYGGEEAYVRFETADRRTKIEVSTEDVVEPEKKGILESLGEAAVRAGMSLTGETKTVRSGKRKAGGETGEELILKVNAGKELSFVWTFPGGEDDPDRPRIDIEMETSSEDEKGKLAMWDGLLDSLRRADAR